METAASAPRASDSGDEGNGNMSAGASVANKSKNLSISDLVRYLTRGWRVAEAGLGLGVGGGGWRERGMTGEGGEERGERGRV